MPRDWKGPYQSQLRRAASERGKRMAKARWAKWHAERERMEPEPVGGDVVECWARLRADGSVIRRRFIYAHDLERDWRRKKRELFA